MGALQAIHDVHPSPVFGDGHIQEPIPSPFHLALLQVSPCASCPSFHPSTSPFSYPSTSPFFPIPEKFFKYMLHVVANKMQRKIFYRVPLVLSSSDGPSLKTHPVGN
jgi:hypothetical protein